MQVCAVVFLGDIRLDQDYIRVAGWSAFSCNLVALGFLAIAAYSSYLARVNRAADVVSTCRLCLAYQYSPLGMHAATALLVLSAFASFSSIMLTSLPNDPTTLNPKYAQEEGEAAGFGSAYGLTVTVFVIELACIGLSGFCAAEADRNPDDFGDSTATAPGFPPSRGEEAAQQFDDVYAMSADGMAEAGVPAGGKAGRGTGGVPAGAATDVPPAGGASRAVRTAAAAGTPSGTHLPAALPRVLLPAARDPVGSGPSVRQSAQAELSASGAGPHRGSAAPGPRLSAAPAVPPRRSMGGPAVRPSVAAADAATLEAVAAAVDTVHAEEVAAGLTGPRAGGDGGHVPVAAPGNPFADDLD